MTDEEPTAVQADNQAESNAAETAAEGSSVPAADAGDRFGDDEGGADNFGEDEASVSADEFEDNFGLGDQQLSAGRIPSVPSAAPKRKTVPPVTPRNLEPDMPVESGSGLSVPPPADDNFDGVNLSVENGQAAEETDPATAREEDLFDRFGLLHVPPEFCKFAEWFRAYLFKNPEAPKRMESMLCDEASVKAVRLGLNRLAAFPAPEFADVICYAPYAMATDEERADWEKHLERFPEYAKLTKGEYPYFDPPQFFYHHGAVFLDSAVTDRLAGGVFYQCGGYCGASLIAMSQYKPAMMYGFEPALGNGVFMQMNVKRAGLENVKMFRLCIGDRMGSAVVPDRDREGKPCKSKVPLVPLDLFREKRGETGRTAWIQADVGGMSLPVLRGAEQMIRRDKPLITVAIYHNPEEFFGIIPLLHEWVPEYKFMVRRCQCNLKITYSEITLIAYVP